MPRPKKRISLNRASLIARILIPVNVTAFVLLAGMATLMVFVSRESSIRVAILFTLLVQVMLSAVVWMVSRSIAKPLQQTLSRLNRTTSVLADTSTDISKFSEYLSSGVNQQAEVVQETTAAMSEISTMLNQASSYAKDSEDVMVAVKQKANNGMAIMNQMVDSMGSVQQANEQLKQMVEIIKEIATRTHVINDIVFKTQLLSFNASIEAARAGQHGRGFAVVAEEVGNLAKTSGSAAQQIAMLLQDSERQVNEIVGNTAERVRLGREVSEQALRNFKEIAADINLMATHISNISSAAREQELGVSQTTQAMSELSNATDLNNGVAQRASDTARTLEKEVQELNDIARSVQYSISGVLALEDDDRDGSDDPSSGNRVESRHSVENPMPDFARLPFVSNPQARPRGASQESVSAEAFARDGQAPAAPARLSTEELGRKIVEMAQRSRDLVPGRGAQKGDSAGKVGRTG